MAEYHTEQKKRLLAFLQEHEENAYTVEELVEGMMRSGCTCIPGKSTVYRLMTRMVEEGTVKRFVKGHSRRFVYQIVMGEDCHSHLHLKCTGCGKLIHLDEALSDELMEKVRKARDFSVDEEETVLFGSCSACRAGSKSKKTEES